MKKYICLLAAAILVSSCAINTSIVPVGMVEKPTKWENYQMPISAMPYIDVAINDFQKNRNILEYQVLVYPVGGNVYVSFRKIMPKSDAGTIIICAGSCGEPVYEFIQGSLKFKKGIQR